jgi:nitrogen fixation protein NifB
VKVNTVLLPGINECHLSAIAREVAAAGASILNIVPHYPVPGSAFADRSEPTAQQVQKARHEVRGVLPLMNHCTRCRADAAGLLGRTDLANHQFLKACAELPPPSSPARPHVAVATREGMLVNGHLGQVKCLWIYRNAGGVPALVERRPTPPPGGGGVRWHALGDRLADCSALFVEALGSSPRQVLSELGLTVFETQGLIDMTLQDYWQNRLRPVSRGSGSSCSRGWMGCG